MKPKIIKADEAGCIVSWDNGNDVYYVGDAYGYNDGVVYKSQSAFDEHIGICYIPEHGFFDQVGLDENVSDEMLDWMRNDKDYMSGYVADDGCGYTRDDLYAAFFDHIDHDNWYDEQVEEYGKPFVEAFIDKEIEYIFGELDWQFPETFMQEMDWEEDWDEHVRSLDQQDPRLTPQQRKELGYE